MKDQEKEVTRHPAFGRISVFKTMHGGRGGQLFGSDIMHPNTVTVKIDQVDAERTGGLDFMVNPRHVTEFSMSEYAWAHFVSSFGDMSGTEVTFRFLQGTEITPLPQIESKEELHRKEQRSHLREMLDSLKECVELLEKTKKERSFTAKTLANIESTIKTIRMQMVSKIPMLENDFDELIERKTAKAKIEFESFIRNRTQQMGMEVLFERGGNKNQDSLAALFPPLQNEDR